MSEKTEGVRIRVARVEDAGALRAIYAPYVEKTAITFEYEVPTEEEFRRRIETTLRRYPYLVAERDGEILGYAYTGPLRTRAAYGWTAESSIYLAPSARRMGLGRTLYHALEVLSRTQGLQTLCACVTYATEPTPYWTDASIHFHYRLGYDLAGQLKRCGYKFGTWFGTCYFEKALGDYPADPAPLIPFPELDSVALGDAGVEG